MPILSTVAPTDGFQPSSNALRDSKPSKKTRGNSAHDLQNGISLDGPIEVSSRLPGDGSPKTSFSSLWSSISADRQTRLSTALPLLQEALNDAQKTNCDPWQFAVTGSELTHVGMRLTDLRWLVAIGVLDHAVEVFCRSGLTRTFRRVPTLAISKDSCFVLSTAGVRFSLSRPSPPVERGGIYALSGQNLPNWDGELRVLTLCGLVVKRFQTPAESQELILTTFHEDGWPARIDDPLRGRQNHSSRDRLHDVVRSLNRNQREGRIRFSRDGKGLGVCWSEAK
jgi:hypothetical protein